MAAKEQKPEENWINLPTKAYQTDWQRGKVIDINTGDEYPLETIHSKEQIELHINPSLALRDNPNTAGVLAKEPE